MNGVLVEEHGEVETKFGAARRIQIQRLDKKPMSFREVWEAFAEAYPDKWAMQAFPPAKFLFDQVNKYHLHVIDGHPDGFDLFDDTIEK